MGTPFLSPAMIAKQHQQVNFGQNLSTFECFKGPESGKIFPGQMSLVTSSSTWLKVA
jgi:hypothetical protein